MDNVSRPACDHGRSLPRLALVICCVDHKVLLPIPQYHVVLVCVCARACEYMQ